MSRYVPEGQRTITESEYHKNQDKKSIFQVWKMLSVYTEKYHATNSIEVLRNADTIRMMPE